MPSRRGADGQDDVAVVLALGLAHHPADRLDDVDHGIAGVEEQHRVQGGHVDAFGQAAGVGQDPAGSPSGTGALSQVSCLLRSRTLKVPSTWSDLAVQASSVVSPRRRRR